MLKHKSKLYSIFRYKCPYCHEGDFLEKPYYKANVKESCSECGRKYAKEPGFFQGSYYVAYALSVAVFVTIWATLELFFNVSSTFLIASVIGGLVLMFPIMYPLSKIIWANLFIKYVGKNSKTK